LCPPAPTFAAATTGTLKIFSETKGIKVYIDETLKGTDVIEIKDLEPGDHYVKITKDDTVLYSELVKVSAGVTSAILIKTKAIPQEQVLDKLYKEQQEYKQNKLDIILSRGMASVGSSYTSSSYFPGYYSIYGSGWTTSSSKAYETTDWKIIKGGVEEITEREFASITEDKELSDRIDQAWKDWSDVTLLGAYIALPSVILALAGLGAQGDAQAAMIAIGIVGTVIGLGIMSKPEPSGHFTTPGDAAKKAFEYNQKLKRKLGLPESYEPR